MCAMAENIPHYLSGLNTAQKEAATHTSGPLLIVAGAGAGKTRTLAHRILHLIETGTPAHKILAITFTNKAAKELQSRIQSLLAGKQIIGMPFASTFHSLCVYILREHGPSIGLSKYFTILDKSDQISLIRRITKELGMDPKSIPPEKISAAISRAKADLTTPNDMRTTRERSWFTDTAARIWERYEEELSRRSSVDFDDLILKTVTLLRNHADLAKHWQTKWDHLHVDEYQDTNVAQYELARLLSLTHGNICVVGDSDQSIFGWRGAHFENILHFERDFPGAKVVLLEENYRSTKNILNAANSVICKNTARVEKKLFTSGEAGENITLYQASNEGDEAAFVAKKIRELTASGVPAPEIAILYRANWLSRVFEERLLRDKIPYQLLGTKFYERAEVKTLLSYIRFALNPNDIESMRRAIGSPSRGIGDTTIDRIIAGREDELNRGAKEKVENFRTIIGKIREKCLGATVSDAIKFAIVTSGLETECIKNSEEERLENLRELASLGSKYDEFGVEEGMSMFLSDAALVSDQDDLIAATQGIRLMTVHASKGLEFDYVFIVGLEDGIFPHRRFDDSSDPEEERRLFYVAVTRARKKLFLSHAVMRTVFGSTQCNCVSEFAGDIDEKLLDRETGYAQDWSFESGFSAKNGFNRPRFPRRDQFDQRTQENDEPEIVWDVFKKK